ncbi:MAG: NUDIX hydrolase [Verrucomicrobia bacterium]|nr:NUDIX hydrolase [Verrucomicrobiota bacterium]
MGKNAEARKHLEEKARVETRWVFEGKYLKVREDIIHIPQESPKIWNIAVTPKAVAVIPIDSQGRLILVEQWRRAIGKISLELPAGMLDHPDESPLDCAQRELQEETGFKAGSLIPFGGCYTSPGTSAEYIHLFLAQNLTEGRLHAEDTAGIDVQAVTPAQARRLIEHGKISDAKTIVGMMRYLHHD